MIELEINHEKLADLLAARLRVMPEWLSPADAATYCGIPEKTLEQYRSQGTGPAYSKVGRHVRYRRCDIDLWLTGGQA